MTPNAENILSVYNQATDFEFAVGFQWYDAAHNIAKNQSKLFKVPIHMAAGVLAATSPNQSWKNNITAAGKVLEAWRDNTSIYDKGIASYPAGLAKAERILKGEDPAEVLNGLKTTAFYNNIVSPWSSTSVTVDGHAYSIWDGKRTLLEKIPSRVYRPKWYNTISDDYKAVAGKLGVKPWQAQAVSWMAWRRIIGIHSSKG